MAKMAFNKKNQKIKIELKQPSENGEHSMGAHWGTSKKMHAVI